MHNFKAIYKYVTNLKDTCQDNLKANMGIG